MYATDFGFGSCLDILLLVFVKRNKFFYMFKPVINIDSQVLLCLSLSVPVSLSVCLSLYIMGVAERTKDMSSL